MMTRENSRLLMNEATTGRGDVVTSREGAGAPHDTIITYNLSLLPCVKQKEETALEFRAGMGQNASSDL